MPPHLILRAWLILLSDDCGIRSNRKEFALFRDLELKFRWHPHSCVAESKIGLCSQWGMGILSLQQHQPVMALFSNPFMLPYVHLSWEAWESLCPPWLVELSGGWKLAMTKLGWKSITIYSIAIWIGTLKYYRSIVYLYFYLLVYADLWKTGMFERMTLQTDEDEHSIEMHLPYTAKAMERYWSHVFQLCTTKVCSLQTNKLTKTSCSIMQ